MNWYKKAFGEPNLIKPLVDELVAKFPGLDLDVWDNAKLGYIHISSIRLPKNMRGQGIGTTIMKAIQNYAQSVGRHVTLIPQPEPRHKKDLYDFYKRLGFIRNRGRHADYRLSDMFGPSMYWKPPKTS